MEPMESSDYFESYQDLEVHKLMLQDSPRNKAYYDAISNNKDEFKDKVVLDVGTGTGILAVFCAQIGAKTVYAVEASDIYKVAEETVKENGLENIVKVIHEAVENVDLPEKVDIIISEWMGFYLFHEGMLDSVIFARDKFLKPNGLMFPESAALYSAPCSVPSMYSYWENVSGVSMTRLGSMLREQAFKKPLTEVVPPEAILSEPEVVNWLDLREVTLDDLKDIQVRHVAVANKTGKYQGICLWFTVTFPAGSTEPITLSTEPEEPPTHWKHTVIVLPNDIAVEKDAPMAYDLFLRRSTENPRRYTIEVVILDPAAVEHPEYCLCHFTKCILTRAMLSKYENDDLNRLQNGNDT